MLRITSYIFIVLLILLALLFAALLTFDINRYKQDIVQAVESGTGREFSLAGDINLALSLVPTLVIEEASLGNAAWASSPHLLTIRRFEAEVDLLPLLDGHLRINRLILIEPELALETDADGRGNWLLAGAGSEPAPAVHPPASESPLSLGVHHIVVESARVSYRDGRSGAVKTVVVPGVTLQTDGPDSPARLDMQVRHDDLTLALSGRIGPLKALLANQAYDIDLEGRLDRIDMAVSGRLERPLQTQGMQLDVRLSAASLANLPRLSGLRLPDVGPAVLEGTLVDINGGHELKGLRLSLGASDARGDVRLLTGDDRPVVYATLNSERLDLTDFQGRAAGPATGPVFSSEPLQLDWLRGLDGNLAIQAGEVRLFGDWRLRDARLEVGLRNGRLSLSPLNAGAAGGDLIGSLEVDTTTGGPPEWRANLHVTGLQPQRLPGFKEWIRDGDTDITVDVTGSGDSPAAIMAGLDGHLLSYTGRGRVQDTTLEMAGADLLFRTMSLLRPDDDGVGTTDIHCAVAAFRIRDGLAVSDSGLALETPRMTAVGGGSINLATEELDLGLRPYPREGLGLSAGRFAELVRLRGTLSEPRTGTDTLAAMKSAARVGAAVATGGISLLAGGLFDRLSADDQPCNTAVAFVQGGAGQTTEADAPAEQGPGGTSLGERVKGMFNGLFGN